MSEMQTLRPGDLFHWHWADPKLDLSPYAYWCKTRTGVVLEGGKMLDLYWLIGDLAKPISTSDERLDPEQIKTALIANLSELTPLRNGEEAQYDPEDVVDLRHSNHSGAGRLWRKKIAVQSAEAMERELLARQERGRSKVRAGNWEMEEAARGLKLVAEGRLDEVRL